MFEARHQGDMPRRVAGPERVEQVADHGGIDADILRLAILPQPGRDEHGVRPDICQRGRRRGPVLQIDRNRANAVLARRPAGEGVHRPPVAQEEVRGRTPDDAARADHQCGSSHDHAPI